MNKFAFRSTAILAGFAVAAFAPASVLFSDNFETDSSGSWFVQRNTVLAPALVLDSSATFNFDYSQSYEGAPAIPPAPGGSTTHGLKVEVNSDPTETLSIEALTAMPLVPYLSGDYSIEYDMWYNTIGGAATTIHNLAGLGHDGIRAFLQNTVPATDTDWYTYGVTADGSSSTDYRVWIGKTVQTTAVGGGYTATGTDFRNNSNALYQALFPDALTNAPTGTPGNRWTHWRIRRVSGVVTWEAKNPAGDWVVISTLTDASGKAGLPTLGMMDTAPSPRQPGTFVVYDNVVVEGSLPATTIQGKATLKDYDTVSGVDRSITLDFYDAGGNTLITSIKTPVTSDGSFFMAAPGNQAYDVYIRGKHWLAKKVSIDTTSGSVSNVNVALTNGDVDGDNAVTVFDYGVLSDYFDLAINDPSWNTVGPNGFKPLDADIDGDNAVSVFDYGLISDNFDLSGDAPA